MSADSFLLQKKIDLLENLSNEDHSKIWTFLSKVERSNLEIISKSFDGIGVRSLRQIPTMLTRKKLSFVDERVQGLENIGRYEIGYRRSNRVSCPQWSFKKFNNLITGILYYKVDNSVLAKIRSDAFEIKSALADWNIIIEDIRVARHNAVVLEYLKEQMSVIKDDLIDLIDESEYVGHELKK